MNTCLDCDSLLILDEKFYCQFCQDAFIIEWNITVPTNIWETE